MGSELLSSLLKILRIVLLGTVFLPSFWRGLQLFFQVSLSNVPFLRAALGFPTASPLSIKVFANRKHLEELRHTPPAAGVFSAG